MPRLLSKALWAILPLTHPDKSGLYAGRVALHGGGKIKLRHIAIKRATPTNGGGGLPPTNRDPSRSHSAFPTRRRISGCQQLSKGE